MKYDIINLTDKQVIGGGISKRYNGKAFGGKHNNQRGICLHN